MNATIGDVVGIASSVAEASATFTPQDPNASIDRAAGLMTPERADAYRKEFAAVGKGFGEQKRRRQPARSRRGSSHRTRGGQRRRGHGGHPERAWQVA